MAGETRRRRSASRSVRAERPTALVLADGALYRPQMQVTLNGESTQLADGATIDDLVSQLDLSQRRIAVEVNRDIVPRDCFAARTLRDGDVIEIVHFIGGG